MLFNDVFQTGRYQKDKAVRVQAMKTYAGQQSYSSTHS